MERAATRLQLKIAVPLALLAAVSWSLGMFAGGATLGGLAGRRPSGADSTSIAVIAAVAFAVGIVTVYSPVVGWLRRRGAIAIRSIVGAVAMGAVFSLVPWILTMILLTAGTFRELFGSAGILFLVVSAVSGALFTAGALVLFGRAQRDP